uniref:Protein ZIP4 homolog n=1 Tax=Gouania willdenowi TaxID=441366 RepID=A0A8C5D8U3_GOUWI
MLTSRGDGAADVNSAKGDVEKELLRILSCQAESAMSQGNHQEAVVCIQRCKDMLFRLPKDTAYLSLLCYNFGVETYKMKMFEDSSFWLSQSYEIGKMNGRCGPGSEALARSLRLLANVYSEWDVEMFQDKALSTVSLANKVGDPFNTGQRLMESFGSLVLYHVYVVQECAMDEHAQSFFFRETLAFEHLKHVCQHFVSSPDLGSALVLHIELLLQRGKELLGKQKIEDIISGHHTGKPLTQQVITSLHAMLWDKASKHFEVFINTIEALQWYNYSLSFFKTGQMEPVLAKLQRNRASCFLHLKQLEKAKEAIKEAERCEVDSIFTQFSVYKMAVQENNAKRGTLRMNLGCEHNLLVSQAAAFNLLSLAAQIALEVQVQVTAIIKVESNIILCTLCVSITYFCEIKGIFLNIDKTISRQSVLTVEQRTHAANWFRKTAWNSALLCERSPGIMREFFVLSYQLSQLCPPDRTLLMGQKTCLLMAVAASLELYRSCPCSAQVLSVCVLLIFIFFLSSESPSDPSGSSLMDPTEKILLLYEFEARIKLNDPMVETVLESVLELENLEAKVLETMAALAMEPPAHFPLLCKKALRAALSLHKKQPQAEVAQCSRCIHSLIDLSLPSGVTEVEAHVLEEVWDYYEEALSIITLDDFPEMETLWLLTRAWNTGILLYSLAQYSEAEKWCGLAMSFVHHLGPLQESFETQVEDEVSRTLMWNDAFSVIN